MVDTYKDTDLTSEEKAIIENMENKVKEAMARMPKIVEQNFTKRRKDK